MFWEIVLSGSNPSGRILAVLCARTGETIDSVRVMLDSPQGMILQSGLSRERADALSAELPNDGSVEIFMQRDEVVCIPVLMGYRPGSRGRLRIALQKLSRLPTEEVIRFLSRIPIALKLDADRATAESIKRILERAGGIVEIQSPQDLVGVSSRRNHSEPAEKTVAVKEEKLNGAVSSPSPFVSRSFAYGDYPPVVSTADYRAETGAGVLSDNAKPDIVNFLHPPSVKLKIPPLLEETIDTPYSQPHITGFTVPSAAIPSVIQGEQFVIDPPELLQETVLVYLYPVSSEDTEHTQEVLCESLGISLEKVQQLINNAPVALAGFSERIDALVTMSELSTHGVPVSLVSGSSSSVPHAPGRSLFGWLNGYERTS